MATRSTTTSVTSRRGKRERGDENEGEEGEEERATSEGRGGGRGDRRENATTHLRAGDGGDDYGIDVGDDDNVDEKGGGGGDAEEAVDDDNGNKGVLLRPEGRGRQDGEDPTGQTATKNKEAMVIESRRTRGHFESRIAHLDHRFGVISPVLRLKYACYVDH